MKVLALPGSLRAASINAAALRAARRVAPSGVTVEFADPGELPLFNPDLEDHPPATVTAFRAQVEAADALLIASPEYAHGVSGTIKNALDWLVSFPPFAFKPVGLLNTSPRAHHAHDALLETLKTMSATLVDGACVAIPLLGAKLDEAGMSASPAVAQALANALRALQKAVPPGIDAPPAFPV